MIVVVILLLLFLTCHKAQNGGSSDETIFFSKGDDVVPEDVFTSDLIYKKIHRYNSKTRIKAYQDYLSAKNISLTNSSIRCHYYADFYLLMYKICNHSALCRELYYIEQPATFSTNFKRFVYQLSLTQLFVVHNFNTEDGTVLIGDQPFILADNWPVEWNPRYIIVLQAFTLEDGETDETLLEQQFCSNALDLFADENIPFVMLSLHLLQTFKTFIVNEYHCYDINMLLVLDSLDKPRCECIPGKLCNTKSTYKIILIVMLTVIILVVIVLAIGVFRSNSKIIKKMDAINRSEKKNQ